jgi:hypothetical protein
MRKEEFAEVLGDINENYVKEARNRKKDKISAWGKWGAVAVCLAVVVAVGVFISRQTTDLTQHNQDGMQEVELAGGNDSDDVYAVYDNLNIVYIKLDNGGKVTLEEETE